MEIQDFRESSHSSYFKEWYGKVIWKGEEIRVSLTISKKCDNVELEKEKMFKIEKSYDFSNMKNKKVSFIIFSDKVKNLTLKGFKYEVENLDLIKGETRCVSNIIEENEARLTLKNGALLCVVK